MSVHKPVTQTGIYFITFTCHQWQPLIEQTKGYDLFYNWFTLLAGNGHFVNAYVLMPNHLHLLMFFAGGKQSLNTIIGNGKRFLAYEMVKRLTRQNETALLNRLQLAVQVKDKSRGKKHEIWESSFDVKECRTEQFIMQKLNYIHNNPCSGKWKLAESAIQYDHSSASFYISGKHLLYAVKDYREFMSFDFDEKNMTIP